MSKTSNASGGGIGFTGMLTIVFITLKLTNYIDWSWWWVLAPLWAPLAIVMVLAIIWFFISIIVVSIEHYSSSK